MMESDVWRVIRMECSKCGSSWETKSFAHKCPFCGAVLNESVKNISFEDTLRMILSQYGVEILKEKKVVSLLKDYIPKETKKIELINIFVTKNVGREFVEMYNDEHNSWENIYEYCIKCLQEDAFLGHDFACLILDDIGNALNIKRNNKSNLLYNNIDVENKKSEDSFRGSGDNKIFCKHSEDKNQLADNLREMIELFTVHYIETYFSFDTDIYFSLIKKVDIVGYTTYEIISKDSDGNRYDDNISAETILKGIIMLQHKNEKSLCNPDRMQIREFLLNQRKKYEEEGGIEANFNDFAIGDGILMAYKGTDVEITIPEGVVEIGNRVFYGDEQLRSVKYTPSKIKKIGNYAFYECAKLSEINGTAGLHFSEGIEEIGCEAFRGCKSIKNIIFPKSIKLIGMSAFSDCDGLESVVFEGDQFIIARDAFKNCKSLKNIVMKEDLFAKFCDRFDDKTRDNYRYNAVSNEKENSNGLNNAENHTSLNNTEQDDGLECAFHREQKTDYASFMRNNSGSNGEAFIKVNVGGLALKRFDTVTFTDDECYMCFAFCKFNGMFFSLCEKVQEDVDDVTTPEIKKYTKHFREYKIYKIDDDGYFNEIVDKTLLLAVLPFLDSSLKKGKGYQIMMKKLLPELVSSEDLKAAENALCHFYETI